VSNAPSPTVADQCRILTGFPDELLVLRPGSYQSRLTRAREKHRFGFAQMAGHGSGVQRRWVIGRRWFTAGVGGALTAASLVLALCVAGARSAGVSPPPTSEKPVSYRKVAGSESEIGRAGCNVVMHPPVRPIFIGLCPIMERLNVAIARQSMIMPAVR
jgi:hypothetical protein